jgi:hypothetical protein
VALVRKDVSEERVSSIIGLKTISELGRTLAVTSNWSMQQRNIFSEILVLIIVTRRYFPDDKKKTSNLIKFNSKTYLNIHSVKMLIGKVKVK